MAADLAPCPPHLPSVKVGTNENQVHLKSTIIIGAASRKIFEKEKCRKRIAAPCLLG